MDSQKVRKCSWKNIQEFKRFISIWKRLIYKINSSNFDSNYFEIELIKEIIFKDKKEELSLIAQKSINNLANQINVIDSKCLIKEEEIISSKNREQEIKKRISEARKDIAKK